MRAILFAATLAACAGGQVTTPTPAPEAEPPEYACVPAPTIAGNEWRACELVEEIPCCGYAVGDCAVVLCRIGGCHGEWSVADKECRPTLSGAQVDAHETCDGAECVR